MVQILAAGLSALIFGLRVTVTASKGWPSNESRMSLRELVSTKNNAAVDACTGMVRSYSSRVR
jgi:hypothetical protein